MVASPTTFVRREIESLDLVRLRDLLGELMVAGSKEPALDTVISLLTKCKAVIEEQAFEITMLERQLFGRKSERCSPDQLSLFTQLLGAVVAQASESVAPADDKERENEPNEPTATVAGTANAKQPSTKKPRRKLEPTRQEVIQVGPDDRPCPMCGGDRGCIGHARSLMIEYTPPVIEVIELLREKLACRRCDGEISLAPAPATKLERSRPGPRLLATLAINKIVDGLPLHRTKRIFGRLGVDLPVQTLNRWECLGYDLVAPVAQRIADIVKASDVINLDDTSLRVRDPKVRGDTVRGHIWTFVGKTFDPTGDLTKTTTLVSYIFAPTWEAKYPDVFLKNSRAKLQGDAYAGYGRVAQVKGAQPKNVLAGCIMHGRRGFFEAMQVGDPGAFFFIERFQRIYEVEAEAKKRLLLSSDRLGLRRDKSLPLMKEMKSRAEELRRLPLMKPMRDAIRYFLNQWDRLIHAFEHDGRLEIDNGEAERRLRRVASGRKAWLFAGSERGAERFAAMLGLVASAEANMIEPGTYLADIFGKLSAGWPARRLDELFPHRWKALQEGAQ